MKILKKSILNFKPNYVIHLAAQAGVRYSIDAPRKFISQILLVYLISLNLHAN